MRADRQRVEALLKVLREEEINFSISFLYQLSYYLGITQPTARSYWDAAVKSGRVKASYHGKRITGLEIIETN